MKPLVLISRIVVGSLFIVSGLIKANDILGFMYKLQEYFEPGALNMEALSPFASELSVFICIGEILLGVALLMGAMPRLTTTLLLAMLLFFTWLTYHTASCDPLSTKMLDGKEISVQCVLECGCFGSAIPLTPWQSFWKDIILLVFLIPSLIWAFLGRIELNSGKDDRIIYPSSLVILALFGWVMLDWMFPVLFTGIALLVGHVTKRFVSGKAREWAMAGVVLIVAGIFQWYTIEYLPHKDWRPYAVGSNIREKMKTADELGLKAPVYAVQYTFTNTKTGKDSIVLSSDYLKIYNQPWFTENYEVKSWEGKNVKISDGYEPEIKDFAVYDYDGESVTDDIVGYKGYTFLHISKDLKETRTSAQPKLNDLAKGALVDGHRFMALTNADFQTADTYKHTHQVSYDFFTCDQTELKIIVRSNPGLVLLHDGVVKGMWSARAIPNYEKVKKSLIR
jgi:uncharacterized membrane protein YphA (DoxX/SURF4 family)